MCSDEVTLREARRRFCELPREQLEGYQLLRLNQLLERICREQPFYASRLAGLTLPLTSLSQLPRLPLLTKSQLQPGIPATICGLPRSRYVRAHQTSGTTGSPLLMLDTQEDWQWWLNTWQYVLDVADVSSNEIAFLAFSYGPFIGFWSAHEALVQRGALVVPGGGMSSQARLHAIRACEATLLCCTPSYALHLASIARELSIDLRQTKVRTILVAGEPGGSIAEVRERIEQAWDAVVVDHCGATEVGPWGVGRADGTGVHVIESEFIAEILVFDAEHPQGRAAQPCELAELVLTNLGRPGAPAIRYRTGDLVRGRVAAFDDNRFLFLEGGVLGRADDMVVIRGVNVFPSSVDAIVKQVAEHAEYRVNRSRLQEMEQLRIEIEGDPGLAQKLHEAFREQLGLRIDITPVDYGTLPRFDGKAKRWVKP